MRYELSLHADDRERYGGPEWFTFDDAAVDDAAADELELLETQLLPHDLSLIQALAEWRHNLTARSVRVVLWLGLHQAGVTVAYADFTPKVMVARMKNLDLPEADDTTAAGGGDADPPDQTDQESPSPSSAPSLTGSDETAPSASS